MIYKDIDNSAIQSFEYETTMISDNNIVGTCELGKATIQLLNDSNKYSIFKDSWIKTIHGSFYIYGIEPVQEKVSIKLNCYDIKYKLDTPYDSSKHKFPCTLKKWRNSIFASCDVLYDNSDFPNSDLILEKEPYIENGSSNRTVIKMIAQAGASAVITDSNDKFYFSWFEEKVHNVEDWIELTTEKENTSPINLVVLGRGDTEDNVYYPEVKPSNPIEFRIDNNYILDPQDTSSTEDLRYITRIPIYNQVNDFSYLIFSMRSQQIPKKLSIKLGEKVKFIDIWGNELIAPIMSKKINWLGGNLEDDNNYEITLSADKISESSTDLKYASNIKNDVLKVERKADKNSGQIQDLISETTENSEKIAQLKIDTDSILQQVSHKIDSSSTAKNTNYLHVTDNYAEYPISFRIIGDLHTLYPQEDLYPSDDLYPDDASYSDENKQYKYVYLSIDKSETETKDKVRLALPLNYLNIFDDVYDEFLVDKNYCTIIRRVGIKDDGSKYKLDEEIIEDRGELTIPLFDGENYIYLENYKTDGLIFSMDYMIHNEYTDEFATKSEVSASINVKADSILQEVSKKYTTIEQTNEVEKNLKSQIESTASSIKSEVSGTYITKTDSAKNISTAKTEAINSANSSTDTKLKNYSTTTEMNTSIEQKVSDSEASINLELKKKVNGSDYTGANIMLKINDDTSEAKINASKITLTAEDILNLIAGNSINLSSKNITIESDNFSVDAMGRADARDLNITGGSISIDSPYKLALINLYATDENHITKIAPGEYVLIRGTDTSNQFSISGYNTNDWLLQMRCNSDESVNISAGPTLGTAISVGNNSTDQYTNIFASGIITPSVTQTSKEEYKKNFELLENGLDIVKNTDIYKYHLKNQEDNEKKHIGFVIGDKYKYADEITAIDKNGQAVGADIYSMISVCFKAIQEQQIQIENLKQEIELLKRSDK